MDISKSNYSLTWNKSDTISSFIDLLVFGEKLAVTDEVEYYIPTKIENGFISNYTSYHSNIFFNMTLTIFKAFNELIQRNPKEFDFQLTDQGELNSFISLQNNDEKWQVKFYRKPSQLMNKEFQEIINLKKFQGLVLDEATFFDFIHYELQTLLLNTISDKKTIKNIRGFLQASRLDGNYHERIPANLKKIEKGTKNVIDDIMTIEGYYKLTFPQSSLINKSFIEKLILKNEFKPFNCDGELSLNVDLILSLLLVSLMDHQFRHIDKDIMRIIYWNESR